MFQVVRKLVYNRVFAVALAVFRISHGNVARRPAFVLVFLPKELQRHARTFQFLMDILVIRLVIQAVQGLSLIHIYNVLAQLQTGNYAKIFILYYGGDIKEIEEKLEQFNQQEIVLVTDNTLKKNEIKIILEK